MIHGVRGGPRRRKPIRPKRDPRVNLGKKKKEEPEFINTLEVIILAPEVPTPEPEVAIPEPIVVIPKPEIDYDNIEDNGLDGIEDEMYEWILVTEKATKKRKKRKYTRKKSKLS